MTIEQYESKVKKLANLLNSEKMINFVRNSFYYFSTITTFHIKKTINFISEITMTGNDKFG